MTHASCISLKGQALPLHTPILFPTSHNSIIAQFNWWLRRQRVYTWARAFQRDLHALHIYRCRLRRLRHGIKLIQSPASSRRSAAPPCWFANASSKDFLGNGASHPVGGQTLLPGLVVIIFHCRMGFEWACMFTHRPILDYVHTPIWI